MLKTSVLVTLALLCAKIRCTNAARGDIFKKDYDFIIVGGGTAGAVLANRLSEVPHWKILLLEAGKEPSNLTDIPAYAGLWQFNEYNWNYTMEPQDNVALGLTDRRINYPRGKVLGGSSILNYMMHIRGNKRDYDKWARDGNTGWSYQELLPYFKKSEDYRVQYQDRDYHSQGGYLGVEDVSYRSKCADTFVKTLRDSGYEYVDYNGREQTGVSYIHATTRNGRRSSSVRAFLDPVRHRRNLRIVTEAMVTKLVISKGRKTVEGVEIYKKGLKENTKGGKGNKNGVKGNKNGGKGNKNGVKGNKNGVKGNRNGVKGNKNGVKGNKNGVKGNKNGVKGNKNGVKGNKNGVKGNKNDVKGNKKGVQGKNGVKYIARAKKEVIVAGGALNSPQILMLSGIGPKEDLAKLNIPLVKDSPVGKKLYDHPCFVGLTFLVNTTCIDPALFELDSSLMEWSQNRGPLTSPGGVEAIAFTNTNVFKQKTNRNISNQDHDHPNIEFVFLGFGPQADQGTFHRRTFRISDETYNSYWRPYEGTPSFTIMVVLLHPYSHGNVTLTSKNPNQHPKFYGNMFTDDRDMQAMVAGIRKAVKTIRNSSSFRKYGARLIPKPVPGCEGRKRESYGYWECAVRTLTGTLHHQSSTCRMGPDGDRFAVVNQRLRVRGVDGLRVVDASVFPGPLTAHNNVPTYMVGEKASDMIKEDYLRTKSS